MNKLRNKNMFTMKKYLLILASAFLLSSGIMAQNSDTEIKQKFVKTEIEKFINECLYSKTEFIDSYKTKSCEIVALVVTNLQTNQKAGGVRISTRNVALAVLSGGANTGIYDLGYLDVSEIDDVIRVLKDILASSKNKHQFEYVMDYYSKTGLYIHFDNNDEVFIRRKWYTTNQYGIEESVVMSTDDISISEVGKLVKKLEDAKAKILEQTK